MTPPDLRVMIVDDHPIVRAGLRGVLESADGIVVVAEAADGAEAVRLAAAILPDVVLMDLRMPVQDGAGATEELLRKVPGTRVLVVTTYDTDADIVRAVAAGAIGYVLKDTPVVELLSAVRAAARGETVLAPTVAARLVQRVRVPSAEHLTPRELEVLAEVAVGRTNAEIGRQLYIGEATVKTHLLRAFVKLGVDDRTAAVTVAIERGLLPEPAFVVNPADHCRLGAMELSDFDRATALEQTGPGRFEGAVHPGWDIGGNANGGYVLALAVRAMQLATGRPDPVTVTAHYLSPAPAGPIVVITELVKTGKRFSTATASIRQGERELVRVLGTFGELGPSGAEDPELSDGAPPDLPPFGTGPRHSSSTIPLPLMDRLAVRLHPDDATFQQGRGSGRAEIRGWFAFADERPLDTLSLMLAADAFPPTVFNLDIPSGWVPTVELTVQVRAVPAPGPLRCRFGTRFVQGGFLEEDGELWDSRGRLVAHSRQLALVPRSAPPG